jgi:hypothetical protein
MVTYARPRSEVGGGSGSDAAEAEAAKRVRTQVAAFIAANVFGADETLMRLR